MSNGQPGAGIADAKRDPAQDLYDAFQLGSLLVELRSRMQIEVHRSGKDAPQPEGKASPQSMPPAAAVHAAGAVEIQPGATATTASVDAATIERQVNLLQIQTNEPLLRAGIWGSLLNRIALLHERQFGDSPTAGTLYDVFPKDQKKPSALWPQSPPDYATLTIPPIMRETKPGRGQQAIILPNLGIYEVLLRTTNCLALLYFKEEDTLLWDRIAEYQNCLLDNLSADVAAGLFAGTRDNDAQAALSAPNAPASAGNSSPRYDSTKARIDLTRFAVGLLEAWENFVRNLYNLAGFQKSDEICQVAFDAGVNIATLSWKLGAQTIGFNHDSTKLKEIWRECFRPTGVTRLQRQISTFGRALSDITVPAEDKSKIQVDAYQHPDPRLPGTTAEAVVKCLDYWQRALAWMENPHSTGLARDGRTSAAASNDDKATAVLYDKLRSALIEQLSIWQSLLANEQKLETFSVQTLRNRLQRDIFDELEQASVDELLQGTARMFAEMQDYVQQATSAVQGLATVARNGLQVLFSNLRPYLILVGFFGLIGLVVLLFMLFAPQAQGAQTAATGGVLTSLLTAGSGILAFVGLRTGNHAKGTNEDQITQKENESTEKAASANKGLLGFGGQSERGPVDVGVQIASQLQSVVDKARQEVQDKLEKGLQQAEVEIRRLDWEIGVAAPLVEFFLLNFDLNADYEVLTKILWTQADQENQFENIKRAAFGSLSLLASSRRSSEPLHATLLAITRTSGTDQWQIVGTVRGSSSIKWSLWLEIPAKDPSHPAQTVSLDADAINAGIQRESAVWFGRLGILDAKVHSLQTGQYAITLKATGAAPDGVPGHELSAQSTLWVDVRDVAYLKQKKA